MDELRFVLLEWSRYEGHVYRGVFASEVGARTHIYEVAASWEGRLLWWPLANGGWEAQMLIPDFSDKRSAHRIRYRFLGASWKIRPVGVGP